MTPMHFLTMVLADFMYSEKELMTPVHFLTMVLADLMY